MSELADCSDHRLQRVEFVHNYECYTPQACPWCAIERLTFAARHNATYIRELDDDRKRLQRDYARDGNELGRLQMENARLRADAEWHAGNTELNQKLLRENGELRAELDEERTEAKGACDALMMERDRLRAALALLQYKYGELDAECEHLRHDLERACTATDEPEFVDCGDGGPPIEL